MIIALSREYAAQAGAPRLDRVDAAIFRTTYFRHCMQCSFCLDSCCSHGVDVDLPTRDRILSLSAELEPLVGATREHWFSDAVLEDGDYPQGQYVRTRVRDGACVFLNRRGRGCVLHAYCVATGRDYHDIKPLVSAIFPATFDQGLLRVSDEVRDDSLVCTGPGFSVYDGARGDLRHYFGDAFVAELDRLRLALIPSSD